MKRKSDQTTAAMTPDGFRAWRKALGLKQKDAAERLGLKKRMIQYYEKGHRDGKVVAIPKTVRLACYALSVGINDFDGRFEGTTAATVAVAPAEPQAAPPAPAAPSKPTRRAAAKAAPKAAAAAPDSAVATSVTARRKSAAAAAPKGPAHNPVAGARKAANPKKPTPDMK